MQWLIDICVEKVELDLGSVMDIADIAPLDGQFIVGDGSSWVGESDNTARTSLGLGTGDAVEFDILDIGDLRLRNDSLRNLVGNLRISAAGGNIDFSADNIINVGDLQATRLRLDAPTNFNVHLDSGYDNDLSIYADDTSHFYINIFKGGVAGAPWQNEMRFWGLGYFDDVTPGHYMKIGWHGTWYEMASIHHQGSSTKRLQIYTGSHYAQIRLWTDGDVELGEGFLNFGHPMADSTKDPTTDAPDDWIQVQIAGSTFFLPAYLA